jgi:hypothetical protein
MCSRCERERTGGHLGLRRNSWEDRASDLWLPGFKFSILSHLFHQSFLPLCLVLAVELSNWLAPLVGILEQRPANDDLAWAHDVLNLVWHLKDAVNLCRSQQRPPEACFLDRARPKADTTVKPTQA